MPQEPKKRHSRARQGKRRAAINLGLKGMTTCTNCGHKILPHIVCTNCGYYKRQDIMAKSPRTEAVKTEPSTTA